MVEVTLTTHDCDGLSEMVGRVVALRLGGP